MKKKKLSYTTKIVIIVTAFLVAIDVILGLILGSTSAKSTKEILNHKMLEMAQTAATLVDGDEIQGLTTYDQENETPQYKHNYDILAAFKTSSEDNGADLAFIYCLVQDSQGTIVFSVDPSDDPGGFLTESPVITDAMKNAFNGVAGVDKKAIVDRWGNLYSAYAPIYNSSKEVIGAIGVDVWAKWYDDLVTRNAVAITVTSMASVSAGVFVALLITLSIRRRFNHISKEMQSLEGEVQILLQEIRKSGDFGDVEPETIYIQGEDTMGELNGQIQTAQKEIKQYIEYSRKMALIDSLTRLNNRSAYFERVKAINNRIESGDEGELMAFVFDVNNLKDINDTYGHEYGDIALINAAKIIRNVYDKANTYRIGGDEIVVILEGDALLGLDKKNDEFNKQLEDFNQSNDKMPVPLSLAIGKSSYKKGTDKAFLDVFRRADSDMYKEKANYHKNHK